MKRQAKTEGKRTSSGKKGIAIIAVVVAIAVTATGLYAYKGGQIIPAGGKGTDVNYSNTPGNAAVNSSLFTPTGGINWTIDAFALNPTYNPLTNDYRPRWKNATDEQYLQIFGHLPKFPQDFYRKYSLFMQGQLTDYDRLGPEYWRQPEFYGMTQQMFNIYMTQHPGQWTPGTVGCKPTFREVELEKGATVSLSTFFHASIVAQAYQGAIFYAYLPDAAINYDNVRVFTQPEGAADHIHFKITEPENDSIYESKMFQQNMTGLYQNVGPGERFVLFYPTYYVVDKLGKKENQGYQEGWCYRVTVKITVDTDCPAGTYDVAVDIKNPSTPIIQEFNWVMSSAPYYGMFYSATREWRPVCPFFQIIVVVR